jgi:hypothetical protein
MLLLCKNNTKLTTKQKWRNYEYYDLVAFVWTIRLKRINYNDQSFHIFLQLSFHETSQIV